MNWSEIVTNAIDELNGNNIYRRTIFHFMTPAEYEERKRRGEDMTFRRCVEKIPMKDSDAAPSQR